MGGEEHYMYTYSPYAEEYRARDYIYLDAAKIHPKNYTQVR